MDRSPFGPRFSPLWPYGLRLSGKGGLYLGYFRCPAGLNVVPFRIRDQQNVWPPLFGSGILYSDVTNRAEGGVGLGASDPVMGVSVGRGEAM